MKALEVPDKIYIQPSTIDELPRQNIVYTKQLSNTSIEYIRKDALLDYFRQRVEELNSPLNGVFGSTERDNCNERISELLLLIDKLNEM